MAKSEKNLWQRIKKLNLKGQLFRIESNTINGIPDVYWLINNKSIWIELKSNDVKNCGLTKFQINWHLTHYKNGGLLLSCEKTSRRDPLKIYKFSWFVNRERWFVPTHHSI